MRSHLTTTRLPARTCTTPPCTRPLDSQHLRIGPLPRSHGVGRVHWWGVGMPEPHHPHPLYDPAQMGGPLPPPSLTRAPPSAGLDDIEAKSAEGQARVGHRVLRRGLLPGVPGAHQFHRKSLRCTAPSKPTSNSLILASFCLRRSSRLVPACVRRKLAQHQSYQSRKGGFVSGRYRYAPRPDPFGWALAHAATPLTIACAPQGRARLSQGQQTIPGSSATFFSSTFSSCPSLCLHI